MLSIKRSIKIFFVLAIFWITPIYSAIETATFAGGCFWCMEPPFESLKGVKSVISGFSGGQRSNPSYNEVASGKTQHIEAVHIRFDSDTVGYSTLLEVFWRQINPTDSGGQFVDRGHHYSTAIFYHSKKQQEIAEASKKRLSQSTRYKKDIVTPIRAFTSFFPAEDYHQDFYKKSSIRYNYYRYRSGRDAYLDRIWGKNRKKELEALVQKTKKRVKKKKGFSMENYKKPSKDDLKEQLTPLQYEVTQEDGTERAFQNSHWDNKQEGIYVDTVSGEPLFSSTDKYESGTGWPSFTKPLDGENVVEKSDWKLLVKRTEVRSKHADSHLGHVFPDGPAPTGQRYCINSAALRFIPKQDLEKEGYGEYLELFK